MAKCHPNDQVLMALLKSAERIGKASGKAYIAQIKRGRRGQVARGYRLTEAHQHVMDTIDAYARCKISDEQAMAVLHEYDVLKARTGK